ncbi:MAG: hypothetical protein UZ11_BCD004001264 [Bacteroidetes bacterium OLB11]|mgnify:CR=1 FL=1|nr:MAG: hypothetical protein UZ11_BCD004001264 [Bacteroidetes bacterium OLB11]
MIKIAFVLLESKNKSNIKFVNSKFEARLMSFRKVFFK